jgi:hypothetical protein|tara:strand:- start:10 stop:240 length:231 start_codon:yes stop_codon:yes gene_type:complete
MSDYEIGVYNSKVREAIRNGDEWDEEDTGISADYENTLYFPVRNAASIEEVEKRAAKSFPSEKGYVVECIMLVRGY